MPFIHKATGARIMGVETRLERVNTIERSSHPRGWKPYWEPKCWPIVRDVEGRAVMKIEGAGHCTEDEIEWREPDEQS